MKVYFCAALDISTWRVLGYSLDNCQDTHLIKDTIQQIRNIYGNQKRLYFTVIKDHTLSIIQLLTFVTKT